MIRQYLMERLSMSDISEALDDTAAQSAPSNEFERLDGPDREPKWKGLLEWLGVFVVAFAVFALIRVFVVSPFVVPSGSMEPTILAVSYTHLTLPTICSV